MDSFGVRWTVLLSGTRQAGERHVGTVAGVNVPPELSVHGWSRTVPLVLTAGRIH